MIFDALPILSAGGGTKIAGPHFYELKIPNMTNTTSTLRLEGKGVLTFWGKYDGDNQKYVNAPITEIYKASSSTYRFKADLEIDGVAYSASTSPSAGQISGGYVDWVRGVYLSGNETKLVSTTFLHAEYVFQEYLEVTFSTFANQYDYQYAFQYYDLDADNPVTVTFA